MEIIRDQCDLSDPILTSLEELAPQDDPSPLRYAGQANGGGRDGNERDGNGNIRLHGILLSILPV